MMGTNMSTVWKLRAARTRSCPSPSVEDIISDRKTTMQEMTSPIRQPVRIEGRAAVSTTVNSALRRLTPMARADQTSFGSTESAP